MPGECVNADSNPRCPYITQINQHGNDLTQIRTALVGADMQSGLVAKVQRLELFMKVTTFITGGALLAAISLGIHALINL